jgi:AcrR family transcriptional regulator
MPRAQHSQKTIDATRQRLTELALDIYREEGLDAVSFRRLAEAAGISHTLPYRYFDSKDALLMAIRVECTQRFEAYVRAREARSAAPLQRIRSVATAYVSFVLAHPDEYQMIFATHQARPDQYPELLGARRSFFDHAVTVVQDAIDSGDLKGDALQLAHLFWVSLHGLMSLHVVNQLVHGYTLEQLVEPLVLRMLAAPLPVVEPIEARSVVTRLPGRKRGAKAGR